MVYMGQPDYVKHGFLVDLLRPWCEESGVLPGDEWGEYIEALWGAADACLSVSNSEMGTSIMELILREFNSMYDDRDDYWWEDEFYGPRILKAQKETASTIAHWRERAIGFNGPDDNARDLLEQTISALGPWVNPPPPPPERFTVPLDGI